MASLLSGFFPETTSTVKARSETTDTLNTVSLSVAKTQEQPVKSSASEVLSGYLLATPTRNVITPRAVTTPNESNTHASKPSTTIDITSPAKSPGKEEGVNTLPSKTSDTRVVPTNEVERNVENELPNLPKLPNIMTPGKETGETSQTGDNKRE